MNKTLYHSPIYLRMMYRHHAHPYILHQVLPTYLVIIIELFEVEPPHKGLLEPGILRIELFFLTSLLHFSHFSLLSFIFSKISKFSTLQIFVNKMV